MKKFATEVFEKKIKDAEGDQYLIRQLKMRQNVEEQILMSKPPEHLIQFYMEAMIQFGFIAMFANTFPLAPLFSFLTNQLEIQIKLDSMCCYSRRMRPEGASGIGAWLPIMEMLAIVCIPVNCAIAVFAGDGSFNYPGESSLQKYLQELNEGRWTTRNILLLVVLIEHALLLFKIAMSSFIADVPYSVRKAIKKRPIIEQKATQ